MTYKIEFWKSKGSKVVTMEYYENFRQPDINISVLQDPTLVNDLSIQYSGLDYIIIRSDIKKQKNRKSKDYGVIMIGGSVNIDKIIYLTEFFGADLKLKIIIGPFTDMNGLVNDNPNHEFIKDPINLPKLMAECSWCITNGGITMLENDLFKKYTSFTSN